MALTPGGLCGLGAAPLPGEREPTKRESDPNKRTNRRNAEAGKRGKEKGKSQREGGRSQEGFEIQALKVWCLGFGVEMFKGQWD